MAQALELLTRRTGTMRSIRGIVRTMKTMAAINALPYERAADAIESYRDTVLDGFHAFAQAHPLPAAAPGAGSPVVIVFGSDHGLCGGYNEIVAAEAVRLSGSLAGPRILCVGAQMEDALHARGLRPGTTLLPPASAEGLGRLSGRLITALDGIRAEAGAQAIAVTLVHMRRASHGRQAPVSERLLPLDVAMTAALARRPWTSRSLPMFRLPPDRLLAALIRNWLFAGMFRAAAEALVTENAARLARMQQAEKSIDERLEALMAETRLVRQSEITTELLDVIVGFEALQDRRKKRRAGKTGQVRPVVRK